MSSRLWWLGGLTVFVLLVGLVSRSGAVFAVGLPFMVYIGLALLGSGTGRPPLEVTRSLSKTHVHSMAPVDVHVQIHNSGPAIEEVHIENPLPESIEILQGSRMLISRLEPGQDLQMDFTVRSRRGSYDLGDLQVTVQDHFNLFPNVWPQHLSSRLNVFPDVVTLDNVAVFPHHTRGFAGPIPSRLGGSGTDFHDIRQYQLGDPLRRINWPKSARHSAAFQQEVFSNIYEMERIADIGVILDARMQSNVVVQNSEADGEQKSPRSLFEYSASAAASLCSRFLADGNRVSLMIFGFGIERVFPGYGRTQRERILRAIAKADTGHNYSLENFSYLPVRMFPSKSQLVIISPLLPADPVPIIRMSASGYEILVVSPNPIDFEAKNMAGLPHLDQAVALAQIERRLVLKRLNRMGIRLVDWHIDQPLLQVLNASLNTRTALRHRANIRRGRESS